MECPRCGLHVTDQVPQCRGCGFSIADLDRAIGTPPVRDGALTDLAGLLNDETRTTLRAHIQALSQSLAGEIAVVTLSTTKPVTPRQYAFWLLNKWDVGGAENKGVLILIAKSERRVECEVGYSWEEIVTDDEAGLILDDAVVPHLKEGHFDRAIRAGADALAERIRRGPRDETAATADGTAALAAHGVKGADA